MLERFSNLCTSLKPAAAAEVRRSTSIYFVPKSKEIMHYGGRQNAMYCHNIYRSYLFCYIEYKDEKARFLTGYS